MSLFAGHVAIVFTAISNHIRYILAPSLLAGRGLGVGFLFQVQAAQFIREQQAENNNLNQGVINDLYVCGQEKTLETVKPAFKPFFDNFHIGLKQLDKTVRAHETALNEKAKEAGDKKRGQIDKQIKELKSTLETLHEEVKSAELFFNHIHWLQERFPHAKYEDVIGLCKLATLEEVKEQDYSLNPGRYVGVVIEEDGKTEEEFIEEILSLNQELEKLNQEVHLLEGIIAHNMKEIAGDN